MGVLFKKKISLAVLAKRRFLRTPLRIPKILVWLSTTKEYLTQPNVLYALYNCLQPMGTQIICSSITTILWWSEE